MTRLSLLIILCAATAWGADSRGINFNSGWKFMLENVAEASAPDFDDSSWRRLDLPHDWAIEGAFSADNPSGPAGGALPGGIGWYRKSFTLPDDLKDKRVFIDFDGAYMNASVYVNGKLLGTRPYGYASFSYDITDCLDPKGGNVVAVRVDNAEQPNSRWYSGCGIYRNTWLRIVDDTHIPKDGTFVTSNGNSLSIDTEIVNNGKKDRKIRVETSLIDPEGTVLATKTSETKVKRSGSTIVSELIEVENPMLWSVDSPTLYTVESSIYDAKSGKKLDRYLTTTGFRSFRFDPAEGFSLNGKRMKLNGVCLHHDAGALGAAVNTDAIRRQLRTLKDMGCNAIRCSHNPPAPELLDLCDRMGLLVMDESFDMWRKRKSAHDYARYFDRWHERDLDDLVRRDRNHPSVVMWSIGNEVLEQWTNAAADTLSLAEANILLNLGQSPDKLAADEGKMSVNSLLAAKLANRIRALDPTRPITAGCNEPAPRNHLFRSGALDIIGYNYHERNALDVPANFPGMPFIFSESISALMTRGYYRMPSDSISVWPARWDRQFFDPSLACSSYDNCHVPWGNTHESTMKLVRDNDYIAGQFVWTGFDYLGEPTPYGWPARSSYFGLVDLAGFPKDAYYLYQSEWQDSTTVLHVFPHWNWDEGSEIDIWAYYNNADEVELFINGNSQGISTKTPERLHAQWRVVFEPGTLTAVSRRDGREVARREIKTAGLPYAIRLTPDRQKLGRDATSLCYVTAEIVDADGNLCPWATDNITFAVDGPAVNEGVDNGSPISHEPFKSPHRKAFYGKALLIVRSKPATPDGISDTTPVTVTASAPGLRTATLILN